VGKSSGLLIVYTGGGNGKTTAALGMAVRSTGCGRRTLILQFIEGSWRYGEIDGLKRLAPEVKFIQGGEGCVGIVDDDKPREDHAAAARAALALARERIASDAYDLVILDEINRALDLGLIVLDDVIALAQERLARLDLVLTGSHAAPEIVELAALVTEMSEIKHPYQRGLKAKKGVDF
jgi:cob(I)alamin adenosyltransferase